jgi:hypothetical protein
MLSCASRVLLVSFHCFTLSLVITVLTVGIDLYCARNCSVRGARRHCYGACQGWSGWRQSQGWLGMSTFYCPFSIVIMTITLHCLCSRFIGLIGCGGSYTTHESNQQWVHGYREGADRCRCIPKSQGLGEP